MIPTPPDYTASGSVPPTAIPQSPTPEAPAEPNRTLVVWCPDWPVLAVGAELDSAAAVVEGGRIVACSFAARAVGVRRGQKVRDAQRLCPALAVHRRDIGAEVRAFEPVLAALDAFTPRVEVVRPGLAALPVQGPADYFGGEEELARLVRDKIGEGGIGVGIGVAGGLFAATLAARHDLVVPPGETRSFLAPFFVMVLEQPELTGPLARLGISTLGRLADMPADTVAGRFGAAGVIAHRLANGMDARPLATRQAAADLSVAMDLDPPETLVEPMAFAAKALAGRLHQRLAAMGMVCDRLEIIAQTADGQESARLWRHDGELSELAVAERCRWQLDAWLTARQRAQSAEDTGNEDAGDEEGTGFIRLRLNPDGLRIGGATQPPLFGPAPIPDDVGEAVERLQNLFGHAAITRPVLVGGRLLAEQVVRVPFGDHRPTARGDGPWPGGIPGLPPINIPTTPLPVELLDADGRPVTISGRGDLSAAPARMVVHRVAIEVTGFSGAWLVSERTWSPEQAGRRVQMQISTDGGNAFLLCLEQGAWTIIAGYQ